MVSIPLFLGATLTLAITVAACSSSSSDGGGTAPDDGGSGASGLSAAEGAGTVITDAFCTNLAACCAAQSQSPNTELCDDDVLVAANIDPSDVVFYGAQVVFANVHACVEAALAYAQSCGDDAKKQSYLASCRRAFTGPVAIGASCKGTLACAQPADGVGFSYCEQIAVGGPQLCVVHLPPSVGTACAPVAPSYADCTLDPTLYCSTVSFTCRAKGAVNQPCDTTGGCVEGAYCGDSQICHAQGNVGDDCGGYEDGCLPGGSCDSTTKKCVAAAKPKAPFSDYCH